MHDLNFIFKILYPHVDDDFLLFLVNGDCVKTLILSKSSSKEDKFSLFNEYYRTGRELFLDNYKHNQLPFKTSEFKSRDVDFLSYLTNSLKINSFQKHKVDDLSFDINEFRAFTPGSHLRNWTVFPLQSLKKVMSYELMRLRSFDMCAGNISGGLLAHSGFYHSGPDGEVTCFSCERVHKNYLIDKNLEESHHSSCNRLSTNRPLNQGTGDLTASDIASFNSMYQTSGAWGSGNASKAPKGVCEDSGQNLQMAHILTSATKDKPIECNPFLYGRMGSIHGNEHGANSRSDNVPLLDLRGAAYPHFASHRMRRDTFQSWDPNHAQRPDNLVLLGFFYAGYSDCARCFYCGLGLKYWRPSDDAAYQHARFRPLCLYNRFVKGQEYVDRVQRAINQEPDEASRAVNPDVSILERHMNSDAVKQAIENGWTKEQVQKGVVHLVKTLEFTGQGSLEYEMLQDVLRNIESDANPSTLVKTNSFDTVDSVDIDISTDLTDESGNFENATASAPDIANQDPEVLFKLVEREHNYLKKRIHCKVCNNAKIGCIYLPCGHVVACQPCGDLASTCVECGKAISATANIYMS